MILVRAPYEDLLGGEKDGRIARRLLAIAFILEGLDREAAATNCGMSRQTLRDWVHRYNAEGVAGLRNRIPQGRPPRLSTDQQASLYELVAAGPSLEEHKVIRWRRKDLRDVIQEKFGVEFHERTVGKHVKKLGFRRLSVRPQHPKADEEAQADFKKNSKR